MCGKESISKLIFWYRCHIYSFRKPRHKVYISYLTKSLEEKKLAQDVQLLRVHYTAPRRERGLDGHTFTVYLRGSRPWVRKGSSCEGSSRSSTTHRWE